MEKTKHELEGLHMPTEEKEQFGRLLAASGLSVREFAAIHYPAAKNPLNNLQTSLNGKFSASQGKETLKWLKTILTIFCKIEPKLKK